MFEVKKIIVALAGPIINTIIVAMFYCFKFLPNINQTIVYANLLIAIFNILPIYPLDGGRILKGILHIKFGKWKAKKYINEISIITCIVLTALASIGILYFKNVAIFAIILFLWFIIIKENLKYKKELEIYKLIKIIEEDR